MRDVSHRRFLLRLPIALLLGMVLWLGLRPVLDSAVSGLAEILIRAFEYPRVTRLDSDEHRAEVHRSDFRSGSRVPAIALTEIHFNTLILLALFLALPRPLSRRQLERLFMGSCILLVIQSLNLVFHVKCIYAFQLGDWSVQNYSAVARNVFGYLRYFTDLPGRLSAPFLIWLGFNWDRVAVLIGARREDTASDSGAPARRRRR